ncbi:MAG TPA: serine hydrolase [Cyclobacteriaceae bacterium]|nr:serine hydrolase [Cyclobacteriaceae bacterium]
MLKKVCSVIALVLGLLATAPAQSIKDQWVDSVFHTLDEDEKIGQLFMVPVYAKSNANYLDELRNTIRNHQPGGLIIMDGGPVQVSQLQSQILDLAATPLMLGINAANGLGKTLDSTMTFTSMLRMGAVRDDRLIYEVGAEIARQMKVLGLHINFAPPVELLTATRFDSLERSFGDSRDNIAAKAVAYLQGLQDQGVIACARNFPVKGLTVVELRKDELPVVEGYIDSVEAYPYRRMLNAGIGGILTASSEFPLFYEKKRIARKNRFPPSILSSVYAGQWLRNTMDFQGLVFVNARDIAAETNRFRDGEAEMLAFQAGNDMILFPEQLGAAVRRIRRLLRKDARFATLLDEKVRKILAVKYDLGLHQRKSTPAYQIDNLLNTDHAQRLHRRLLERSVTVVRNDLAILPLRFLENRKFATVSVGLPAPNTFTDVTGKYVVAEHFVATDDSVATLAGQLEPFTTIVVGLFADPNGYPAVMEQLAALQAEHEVILAVFGSPLWLTSLDRFNTVVEGYEAGPMGHIVPQSIFGALDATGMLPLTVGNFTTGSGDVLLSLQRLGYSYAEDVELDSRVLEKIGAIAEEAITMEATPGCYVLVARKGKVVYEKAFGHLTYDSLAPEVTDRTIYDLASVTKVAATLQAVMFLQDRGLIDIYRKASYYLPRLRRSNKRDFTVKDILTHQAGLWPFLPFWAQTMKSGQYLPGYYDTIASNRYPYLVAEGLYASAAMRDSVWNWVVTSRVREKPVRTPYDYRYSDMGFYILQQLSEAMLNQPMEDFLQQNLYEPLGATSVGYLPLRRFDKNLIAPTERDTLFRKRLLIGTVHDQGAAMFGGVAGHAGLFSNANDLAKLAQMLLQEGYYGGIRYYRPETVRLFTQKQFDTSRRGLGWDKGAQSEWNSPTSLYASPATFGHTGFTGTCMWVDPEFDLVYIFLSNRVHPKMTNNKLLSLNIRSRIQDVIYESIFSYCTKPRPVYRTDTPLAEWAPPETLNTILK